MILARNTINKTCVRKMSTYVCASMASVSGRRRKANLRLPVHVEPRSDYCIALKHRTRTNREGRVANSQARSILYVGWMRAHTQGKAYGLRQARRSTQVESTLVLAFAEPPQNFELTSGVVARGSTRGKKASEGREGEPKLWRARSPQRRAFIMQLHGVYFQLLIIVKRPNIR